MATRTKTKTAKQPAAQRTGTQKRATGKRAAAHARAADVQPEGSNAVERESSATGRMHVVPPRELRAPKPRRKKPAAESGFGFKQIEERYTTRGKTGVSAEPRQAVPEVDEEVEEQGVGQGRPAAGFVDYDKQEHTPDEAEEVAVDYVAPAAEEE